MDAQEVRVETEVKGVVEASVEEKVSLDEKPTLDVKATAEMMSSEYKDDCSEDTEMCRAEVASKRDMPKFQVVAKRGVQVLFWTFDGRRELDTALAENDYDEVLKIYRGKEIPFRMKKGIMLS